ncbi:MULTISPECIES: porin [unclassified Burkholderia]|uniref:porin n=1 Tax=unclassified Burkholderia TaxID=2613784 RepID=UPI00141ED60F|nr:MULTISPECIES: porin [unclassified Burkholderia]NIE84321.1 porin [Burkholderia sp. Tr-860]NIF67046.1 porin [Burkholderia sp. Cy-647]NIF94260.1 porin [Burkholderia sp. Ax-1720]
MKKAILVLPALGLMAGAAHAQSSVTLYGILDEGLMLNTNAKNVVNGRNVGGRQFSVDSNAGTQGSRWGLKGREELGGGLAAIFQLESGFNVSNGQFGQGGTAFGRQAYVGLASRRFGTLTLGRQYDSVNDYVGNYGFAAAYGGSTTEHPGDLDNVNHTFRANNTVKYASPNFSGLTFGGTATLGGVAGQISQSSGYTLGVNYSAGPLGLGAAYEFFRNPSATGAILNSNASAASFNSLNSGYLGTNPANSLQIVAVGGSYRLGAAVLGAVYSNTRYQNIGAFGGASATFNSYEINALYRFTPAFSTALEYNYTKGNAVRGELGDQSYNQASLLFDYALSKRTDVYLLGTFQTASGTSSTGARAVADIGGLGDSSNNHQAVVRVAIHHKF